MSDAVKLAANIAFTPNGGSPMKQGQGVTYALANAGTLQSTSYGVIAGIPKTVVLPTFNGNATAVVMFVVDDAVNPQPVTFAATFTDLSSNTVTQSTQVSAACPYIGPWCAQAGGFSTTMTNNGTGTTTVRVFVWGN